MNPWIVYFRDLRTSGCYMAEYYTREAMDRAILSSKDQVIAIHHNVKEP